MVNNEAIVSIINKITTKSGPPCKKTLQKIVFLIEAKKVNLGCDYGIHFYGPYSSDLDFAVRELCGEGILNIEYTSLDHKISVSDDSSLRPYDNPIVNTVIDEFSKDTPSELELLATALYVYLNVKDINKIRSGVIKIKGNKYPDHRIASAITRLQTQGYFTP